MKLVSSAIHSYDKTTGARIMSVVLLADTKPEALPITGEGIEGLVASDTFAPFSMIFIVGNADTKLYIANEDGIFVGQ